MLNESLNLMLGCWSGDGEKNKTKTVHQAAGKHCRHICVRWGHHRLFMGFDIQPSLKKPLLASSSVLIVLGAMAKKLNLLLYRLPLIWTWLLYPCTCTYLRVMAAESLGLLVDRDDFNLVAESILIELLCNSQVLGIIGELAYLITQWTAPSKGVCIGSQLGY